MDLGELDAIWWYRDMQYLGIPYIDGLSTRPPGFEALRRGYCSDKENKEEKIVMKKK